MKVRRRRLGEPKVCWWIGIAFVLMANVGGEGQAQSGGDPWTDALANVESLRRVEEERQRTRGEAIDLLAQRCRDSLRQASSALSLPPGEIGRERSLDAAFLALEQCAESLHGRLKSHRQAADEEAVFDAVKERLRDVRSILPVAGPAADPYSAIPPSELPRPEPGTTPPASTGTTSTVDAETVDSETVDSETVDSETADSETVGTETVLPEGGPPPVLDRAAWLELEAVVEELEAQRRARRAQHLERISNLLAEVADSRWQLAPKISKAGRARAAQGFFTELSDEIEAVPDILRQRLLQARRTVRAWPALLTDVLTLRGWLWEAGVLLALALIWWRWRHRAEGFSRQVSRWLEDGSERRRTTTVIGWPQATGRLIDAGAVVWTACLDGLLLLAVYVLLMFRVEGSAPWVVMGLLWLGWRLIPSLAILGIASPIEQRPALMVGNRGVRDRIAMTLRSLVLWGALSLFVMTFMRQVLVGFRLHEAAQVLARWLLLALVIYLLHRWAPLLRRQVRRLGDDRWNRWLGSAGRGPVANLFKAACAVGYLCLRLIVQQVARLSGKEGDFSWWTLRLARGDLQESQKVRQPLTPSERRQIETSEMTLSRTDELKELEHNLGAWQEVGERGLTALIGERGAGKSQVLRRIARRVEEGELGSGLTVVQWRLQERSFGVVEALRWMVRNLRRSQDGASATAQEEPAGAMDLATLQATVVALLEARPPTLFLVDDVHYLVLRTVGGFDAFKAIKTQMYASSERHFWILGFHRPAWAYLQAVAVDVNLDVFRTRLDLTPWKAEELATWLSGRTQAAGFELDFSRLVRRGPFDDESQQEQDRARQAYWQLLANASSGNPDVAMLYWLDSLCQDTPGQRLAVTLFEEPPAARLAGHGDRELFVLAALWMHGRLDPETLAEVLNMPLGKVEMSCRHLDSIDVVNERAGLGFAIEGRWRPPVGRLLRQRNFLHWEG